MSDDQQLTELQSWQEVPEFISETEEADFWATHSLGELLLAEMGSPAADLLPPPRSHPLIEPL